MKTKPFDLERALAGDMVVTRDSRLIVNYIVLMKNPINGYVFEASLKRVGIDTIHSYEAFYTLEGLHERNYTKTADFGLDLVMIDDTFKVELGKFYRTKNNNKAFIYHKNKDGSFNYVVQGSPIVMICIPSGNCSDAGPEEEREYDLIEERKD